MKRSKRKKASGRARPRRDNSFPLAAPTFIDPDQLLRGRQDKLGAFHLALSVAYNDIKDILTIALSVQADLATAEGVAMAEFRGRHTMLHRYLAGALHGLIDLIKVNHRILNESEFKRTLANMPPEAVTRWERIVSISVQRKGKSSIDHGLEGALTYIRNNASFHYTSLTALSIAWDRLSQESKRRAADGGANGRAFYSLGVNMPSTRFNFADVALQELMSHGADRYLKPPMADPRFDARFLEIAFDANIAIAALVGTFLRLRAAAVSSSD
jgi:hypothetical protein